MANRNYTSKKIWRGIEKTVLLAESRVSNADTITLNELKATANPLTVYIYKKTDGTEITNTHAAGTNIVTVTGAGTDLDCFFTAYGYKV